MKTVWLLTTGDGSDGNEWRLESIHSTKEGAVKAKAEYEKPRKRLDGSTFSFDDADIEEWDLED